MITRLYEKPDCKCNLGTIPTPAAGQDSSRRSKAILTSAVIWSVGL